MNSRERVKITLEHKEPDRVPIDFGSIGATGISAIAYKNLCNYLNINCEFKISNLYLQNTLIDVGILNRFHVDLKAILPVIDKWRPEMLTGNFIFNVPDTWRPVTQPDGSKIVYYGDNAVARMPDKGYYFDHIYWPLKDASIEDLDNFSWTPPFSFYQLPDIHNLEGYLKGIKEESKYWCENSDFALVGNFGGSIFEAAMGLVGYERFFMDIISNQKFIEKLLAKLLKANLEYAKRYLDKVGSYIDVINVGGEDSGSQNGLLINPKLYREIIKPKQKELWQFIKNNSKAKLLVHSCGSISEIIEDFIESGIDAINPVQTSAKNMNPRILKEKFGDKITFWGGGCDTQNVISSSVNEIEKEVKDKIKILAPKGGYIFSQEQIIQPDIKPENIVALFDNAHKYGKYPLI
jgi:uroporphyrinogen decarboxylase